MDAYTILKFLHIVAAIAWLGGAFVLVILAIMAERARDEARMMAVVSQVVAIAPRVFVPGTVLVLVFGLLMVWIGNLAWDAWIVLGLVGILVTGGLGALVLTPLAGRSKALTATPGKEQEALAVARRLLALAKFDLVMLFSIVFLMVVKPGWSDWPALLVAAAAVMLGAASFLRPARRRLATAA
jgi:uncharacterized membrane protein